jgi:hypothetical protein
MWASPGADVGVPRRPQVNPVFLLGDLDRLLPLHRTAALDPFGASFLSFGRVRARVRACGRPWLTYARTWPLDWYTLIAIIGTLIAIIGTLIAIIGTLIAIIGTLIAIIGTHARTWPLDWYRMLSRSYRPHCTYLPAPHRSAHLSHG